MLRLRSDRFDFDAAIVEEREVARSLLLALLAFYFVETDNLHWQGWHWQDSNFLRDCNQDGGA